MKYLQSKTELDVQTCLCFYCNLRSLNCLQNAALEAENAKEKALIEALEQQLQQEREKTVIVTKVRSY